MDNGSTDGSVAAIRSEFPQVDIIENNANLGYAGGVNVGLRAAMANRDDWALLLNNDARLEAGTLERLIRSALEGQDVAAVCPLVTFEHPPGLVWYAGAKFDPSRARSGRVVAYRRPVQEVDATVATVTDRATGAAMLIPRVALDRVGVLDDALFFQFEEVDWSLRARAAGLAVLFEPRARVVHAVAASSGGERSALATYYATRNHLVTLSRYGAAGPARAAAREAAVVLLGIVGAVAGRAARERVPAIIAGWRDFRAGRLGPRAAPHE